MYKKIKTYAVFIRFDNQDFNLIPSGVSKRLPVRLNIK